MVNKRDKSFKGFTLIELLVVVAVIGILSSVGIMSYNGYVKSSKQSSAKNILMQIGLAQTEYFSNYSYYYSSSETCEDAYNVSDHSDIGNELFSKSNYIDNSVDYSFCVIEDVEYDGCYGYWAEDEDTGEVGFLDELEDAFWVWDEEEQAFVGAYFQGRKMRHGTTLTMVNSPNQLILLKQFHIQFMVTLPHCSNPVVRTRKKFQEKSERPHKELQIKP